jgi:hypothetical protein
MMSKPFLITATLLAVGFANGSFAQTALQPCSGETSTWNECTGTLQQKDGTTYVGEFRNGLFDGKGTLSWKDGDAYTGDFKNGVREGAGTVTLSKVAKVSGRWSGGRYLGP